MCAGVAYSTLGAGTAGARPAHSTTEAHVATFFKGLFQTLAFMVVVIAVLFGIFTLVSYLAGPVGG